MICGHDESEKPPIIMTPDGKRKVIHVSFSPCNVDNVYSPTLQVVGDVANAVWQIHEKLKASNKKWDMPLMKRYKELTDPLLRNGMDDGAFPMNICRVVSDIRKVLPEDGILSLDNGLYKVVFARLFQAYLPNTVLLDNALATMGAGVPNAIAAKFVFPDRKVVSISGDGGFAMNQPELTTCIQYKLNVVHIVLNDNVRRLSRPFATTSSFCAQLKVFFFFSPTLSAGFWNDQMEARVGWISGLGSGLGKSRLRQACGGLRRPWLSCGKS